MNILEDDEKYILNTYKRTNLNIDKIRGSYIYTTDGNKYLDFFSGIAVNNLGYDDDIVEAIKTKLSKYIHTSNYFADEDRNELAKLLIENSIDGKVFFTNSGTESTEAALKLVKKWGNENNKHTILTAFNSFHGRTTGALALTGQNKYQDAFRPLIPNVDYFKYNDISDLEDKVNEDISAVFVEVIQGEGGVVPLEPVFIQKLMELKEIYGFIIVVDEIQTGLGRCGKVFAYQNYNIVPDIILTAKSLGGGLPLGAMIVSNKYSHVLTVGDHGSTFGGNPVACAAGVAVLKKITNEEFQNAVAHNSAYMFDQLKELKQEFPHIIKDIRGKTFMLGVDAGKYSSIIKDEAMSAGVLLNITNSTVIRLIPPLTISLDDIDLLINVLRRIMSQIKND